MCREDGLFWALRPGMVELFSLQWSAFGWQRNLVRVKQGKNGMIKTVLLRNPAYIEEAQARFRQDMAAGIPLVCHRHGMKVLSFRTAWQSACKRAGVKMRPNDIRHLSSTAMLAQDADLSAVAAQLGHASVATTGATYAHVTPTGQAIAAETLPAIDSATPSK